MAETLERVVAAKPATRRSVFVFRFASTLVLWSIALGIIFSGYELAFFALIGTIGLLSLWEFYGMTTTAFTLDGYRVVKSFGVVRGIIVRSRSIFGTIGAGLQTLVGGNISIFSDLCEQTRKDALDRMPECNTDRDWDSDCDVDRHTSKFTITDLRAAKSGL